MEPKLVITYSVRKSISSSAFSADNKLGTAVYCIDPVNGENGHTCTQSTVGSKSVERYLEEFVDLHQKLLSLEEQLPNGGEEGDVTTRGVPQLNLDECKLLDSSTRENGAFSDKEREGEGLATDRSSKILEDFLNQVVNSPHLQNEQIVTNFLSLTSPTTVTAAEDDDVISLPATLTNGVKEQEPSVGDVTVNGRVASEEDISTEQGMDVVLVKMPHP